MKEVGIVSIELLGLALGTIVISSLLSAFWVKVGEENIDSVREYAFKNIMGKNLEWFDIKVNAGDDVEGSANAAGGLMAKFSK
jgi:ATP-binding cassette subfamily B (MDR/TAP) protein 1